MWTDDNLEFMRGMNAEAVISFYLDPPFNSKVNYAERIGSQAVGTAFKDMDVVRCRCRVEQPDGSQASGIAPCPASRD